MKKGLTSIIIAVANTEYFQWHYTGNCLGRVREHTPEDHEVIIIDNGSTHGKDMYAKYCDKYHRFEENQGVSKAWNKGIELAEGEFICILNNDVEVFEYWLGDLLQGLQFVDVIMSHPMYDEAYGRAVESANRRKEWLDKPYEESLEDFKDFSCFAFKRELVDKLDKPFFDENIVLGYGEDVDLTKRVEAIGGKLMSTQRVRTLHIIGSTSHGMKKEDFEKHGVKDIGEAMNKNKEYIELKYTETKPPKKGIVRTSQTGDKIYLIKEGKRHWITNPDTLKALGFSFGEEKLISHKELLKIPEGEPLSMALPGGETLSPPEKGQSSPPVKPVLGYRKDASLETFEKYNE